MSWKFNMVRSKVADRHWKNLLAIYDVLVDIEEARQMDPDRTVFPLLPKIVKFVELMPADSIGLRDNYCESRWRAVKYIERIGVVRNVSPRESNHRWETYVELIPNSSEFQVFYKEVEAEYAKRMGSKQAARSTTEMKGGTKIFIVHGRDLRLRDGMFTFLRSIGLEPIEWIEAVGMTGKSSPYLGQILETAFSNAQAIVVMLTGDDEARLRTELCQPKEPTYETEPTPQARPNVLFEAGMAMAYDPDRTVLVEFGNLRPFSDVAGRHSVKMDGSTQKRQELASRIEKAGCLVRLTGTDRHRSGDLRPAP
jgi:predicted nucleotide-binding protein